VRKCRDIQSYGIRENGTPPSRLCCNTRQCFINVLLNVIMLSVIMLSVIMLSVNMVSVIRLEVIVLSVTLLNIIV